MRTYLSIDCDFFYDTAADLSLCPKKMLAEDLGLFARCLPRAPIRPVLCLDHHEMLLAWDQSKESFDVCLHFDAHSDLFTDFNRAWEMPLGTRGQSVGVGDYLFHALREEIIKSLVWICPRWLDATVEKAKLERVLGSSLASRVQVVGYSDWTWNLPPPTAACLCLSPEWTARGDLLSFRTLATDLGAMRSDCDVWQANAVRRYDALSAGCDPLDLRFKFPYKFVSSDR